jgi:IstB-like ATP binding protein
VLYHRVPRLLENLGLARGDGRYARMLKSLARVQVLILDDWGITPLTAEQRRDLLEIVDDRHGRASTVVTSQLPVAHWHEHIGNPTIADAVLDRLVHTAHRIELKGESLRNCVPRKRPGLTRPPAPEPNVAVLRTTSLPRLASVGITGWLASESVAGFDRNRWLASSESARRTRRLSFSSLPDRTAQSLRTVPAMVRQAGISPRRGGPTGGMAS